MFMSPRTRIALTADPGSSGSGCLSLLTEPAPITGMTPADEKSLANSRIVSVLNPVKTSGVSIGFSRFAYPDCEPASLGRPGPEVRLTSCLRAPAVWDTSVSGVLSISSISSIDAAGVMPQIGSLENSPMR